MIFVVGVGLARFDAMLKGVGQAVEIAQGPGMADEIAEVVEPGLRALFLVQSGVLPGCDEFGRGHGIIFYAHWRSGCRAFVTVQIR